MLASMADSERAGTSKKRAAANTDAKANPSNKVAKIHSFFSKTPSESKEEPGPFKWLESLGEARTCLHGINLTPKNSNKVAAFDLDGTIIKSDFTNKIAVPQWEWWRSEVPAKLQELSQSGYAIVIISNQGIKLAALKAWKHKIPLIAAALPTVPFRIFAATAKDKYRKPMPGMWNELERIFRDDGVEIDKSLSFFVGDAAGRQYPRGKGDFASTDRKWAINIGLSFSTPEEYFLGLPAHKSVSLPGFHVSSLPNLPLFTPSSSPVVPNPPRKEIVLFVGYPCLGKSSFFHRNFKPEGYVHVNQDTLKTRAKCVKAVEEALEKGQSCAVDNTNRDQSTRKFYVDISKKLDVPIRCFLFTGTMELAWHNNLYRAFNQPPSVAAREPKRELVPYMAFTGFRDNYEEPQLSEGYSEIKKVNWVFEGTEEERKQWSMWHQIDGK